MNLALNVDVVARFLAWACLRANPTKYALLAVCRNTHGNHERDESVRLALDDERISARVTGLATSTTTSARAQA